MTKAGSKYHGPTEPPTYNFTPLEKPLAQTLASAAMSKQESDADFEVVHVFPAVPGVPRLKGME